MPTPSPTPTCKPVLTELKKLGKESHRKTFIRHGAPEDSIYGVPIADLKIIQKRIKKNYPLSLDLFDTGNSDAMYLAALIADETLMTRTDLNKWARQSTWGMIGTSVAWVAGESKHATVLSKKWIDAKQEKIAAIGWQTVSSYISVTPDEDIDDKWIGGLLDRVAKEIHGERNDVKDTMNRFVIATGSCVSGLHTKALKIAKRIGSVEINQGDTACKVPDAAAAIQKVAKSGRVGKKRKTARC